MNSQVHQNNKLCQYDSEVKEFKTVLNLKRQKINSPSSNVGSSISPGSTGSSFSHGRGSTCCGFDFDSEDLNEPQDCSEEGNQCDAIFPQLFVRQQTRLVKTNFKIAVSSCLLFILCTLLIELIESFIAFLFSLHCY